MHNFTTIYVFLPQNVCAYDTKYVSLHRFNERMEKSATTKEGNHRPSFGHRKATEIGTMLN